MLAEALFFSAVLFVIGVVGVLIRRNAIIVFMCVELMLNAVNLIVRRVRAGVRRGGPGVRVLRDDGRRRRSGGRAGDHHRALPSPADGQSPEHQPAQRLMLLPLAGRGRGQRIRSAAPPPSGSGLVPLLPLLGFVINGVAVVGERVPRGTGRSVGAARRRSGAHDDARGTSTTTTAITTTTHHAGRATGSPASRASSGRACCVLSFMLAVAIFIAMRGAGEMHAPFVQRYFSLDAGRRPAASTPRSSSISCR